MSSGIITFRSDRFDTSPLEDGLDPEQHPYGRDLARYLLERLRSLPGITEVSSDVGQEHDQWDFDLTASGKRYTVAAHITAEDTPQTLWAVQIYERVGFLQRLIRGQEAFYEVDDVLVGTVSSMLQETEGVTEVQQLSSEQFRKVY